MKLKFRTQLLIPSMVSLVLMIIIGVVVFLNINKLLENRDWVEHTNEVIADANELAALMIDQETGMRGFALTGEEEFLDPYKRGKVEFAQLMNELKLKVSDNPIQVERLERMHNRANFWDSIVASRFIDMRKNIKSGESIRDTLFAFINSGIGKKNMDEIRKLLSESGLSEIDQNQILVDMTNMETGLRGFLLNNKEEYLEPYTTAQKELKRHLNNISVSRRIRSSINTWINDYAEKAIEMNREAMRFTQMDELYKEFNKKLGKTYMDEIRVLIGDFKRTEQSLLVERKDAEEKMAGTTKSTLVILTILAILLSIVFVLIISNRLMNQLGGEPSETEEITRRIAEGDLNFSIERNSENSRGVYKSSLVMLSSLKEMATQLTKIAEGDLTSEITPKSEKDVMGQTFLRMQKELKQQIYDITGVVSTLNSANAQLMSTITQLTSASAETSSTVSEVTTTIEEVKQTADASVRKAKNVSESANKSVKISEKGIQSTEDSIEGMNTIKDQVNRIADTIIKLSEQSQTIGDITSSVNDLAEQSNLLALNASIEAVKAGEYGKGFGVVAHEIRNLADQSKQATKQIKDILNEVQKAISSAVMATEEGGKAVEKGVSLSELSGDAISMLADSISEAAQASTQIAASSQQQLTGMEQLAMAMNNIKQATQQNNQGNKETEKAVSNLKDIVESLKEITKKYKF